MPAPLLLASGSPRRRALLREAGFAFEVGAAPAVDESVRPGEEPGACVERLARLKAEAAMRAAPGRLLLTADTLVFRDGVPLGKPAGPPDARRMLRTLSGRTHDVLTGVALGRTDAGGVVVRSGHVQTRVRFRTLEEEEIAAYVATGEPLDKAGAYAIQGGARGFVSELDGPEDNVIGLPLGLVRALLAAFPGPA
jgi:septum formation protein